MRPQNLPRNQKTHWLQKKHSSSYQSLATFVGCRMLLAAQISMWTLGNADSHPNWVPLPCWHLVPLNFRSVWMRAEVGVVQFWSFLTSHGKSRLQKHSQLEAAFRICAGRSTELAKKPRHPQSTHAFCGFARWGCFPREAFLFQLGIYEEQIWSKHQHMQCGTKEKILQSEKPTRPVKWEITFKQNH